MLVRHLDQVHPDYDHEQLEHLEALHSGGKEWREHVDHWLPQYAREPDEVWAERKKLAGYINDAGPIVSMLSALIFSESPQIAGLEGPFYDELLTDADRQGTPWSRFWSHGLEDAQVGRRWYCWVNMPSRDGLTVKNRADEDKYGLRRAFVVSLTAEQVRNWGRDKDGLSWIMARGVVETQAGPTAPRQRAIRWTAITRTETIQWEWVQTGDRTEPGPDEEAPEIARVGHSLGKVPVVELHLPEGLWTMGKLADAAVMSARAQNDLAWALHQAANELLVIKSKASGSVTLGHGAYLALGPEDSAQFIGPSGVAFEHLENQVKTTREAVYRVVHQMAMSADGSASNAARSGESKAMDWQALEIILASYQDLVLGAMQQALRIMAELRGEQGMVPGISVSGLEGWRTEDLGAWLEQVLLSAEAPRLSPTYRREIGKVQALRLLKDHVSPEVMTIITGEIEDSPEADPLAAFKPPGSGQ